MASPILFPQSHAPGKDAVEGAGSLVNAYAEPLQEGGPSGHVIRRPPGLTQFADLVTQTITDANANYYGLWFDGDDTLWGVWDRDLVSINVSGTGTVVDTLPLASGVDFIQTITSNGVTATTYTYSSVSLGEAASDRMIVVGFSLIASTNTAPSSVTVDGNAATKIVDESISGVRCLIYAAIVASNTSGDVVLNFAASALRYIGGAVWRVSDSDGVTASDTDSDSTATSGGVSAIVDVPANGAAVGVVKQIGGFYNPDNFTLDADLSSAYDTQLYSSSPSSAGTAQAGAFFVSSAVAVAASWSRSPSLPSPPSRFTTFAKDNASTPNQVLCAPGYGGYSFTSAGGLFAIDVDSKTPNSVCYGEGYFFWTVSDGLCYASNLNSTTVTATDYTRAEARAEPLVRGVYYRGELFLFGETHTEVYASNGNPNATGFPLNYTTSIWRGLLTTGAVCGFEESFEGQLIWVADDYSVRQLSGYEAVPISPPDLERDIEACGSKSTIRCWVYDVDGHACVGVHLPGTATWVYDLSTGFWHTRKSLDAADCRLSGNTVRAFDKWIGGDTDSGDLLYLDDSVYTEVGDAMTFEVESIAMEAFPQRLHVSRADFNFVGGVGTTATPDPMVKISWSDDGGHTWSDPVSRKLGEAGRYLEQVRVNRVGLTKHKGRRWRLQVSDEVYVGLLGGSMEVAGRP